MQYHIYLYTSHLTSLKYLRIYIVHSCTVYQSNLSFFCKIPPGSHICRCKTLTIYLSSVPVVSTVLYRIYMVTTKAENLFISACVNALNVNLKTNLLLKVTYSNSLFRITAIFNFKGTVSPLSNRISRLHVPQVQWDFLSL
jgi:hypothetical protein